MTEKLQVALVIEKPEDEELLAKLQKKLAVYVERMGEYTHPELQLLSAPDAYFKYRILETVLKSGKAEYVAITKEISEKFPDSYSLRADYFPEAWGVIWDYCVNKGKHAFNDVTGQPGLA